MLDRTVKNPSGSFRNGFEYVSLPSRVLFGTLELALLAEEMQRLGIGRALVVSTLPQQSLAYDIRSMVGSRCVGVFSGAVMHTPVDVTEQAIDEVRRCGADGIVAIGGGSTIGLSKAIALRTDLPQLSIPTTYAGSEMTPILGETANGVKRTQSSHKVLPETVVYDAALTLGLPALVSASSGIDAIAHAVEALYARERNPITSILAHEGISALAWALPRIVVAPSDVNARFDALYGGWLCGVCLGTVRMGLHHKLCHVLGGMFDLPHAETHAIILPHALAYNAAAAPDAIASLGRTLQSDDPIATLFDLTARLGLKQALRDIGMPQDGIESAADAVSQNPHWNPRALERDPIRNLIARAWAGDSLAMA